MNHELNVAVAKALGWKVAVNELRPEFSTSAWREGEWDIEGILPDFSGNYQVWQRHVAPEVIRATELGISYCQATTGEWGVFFILDSLVINIEPLTTGCKTIMEAGCRALVELKK